MALDYFSLGHPLAKLRSHYALAARKKMFDLFMDQIQPGSEDSVLDLGATPDTSLAESNFFERWYPYPQQLTAASIENISSLAAEFPHIKLAHLTNGLLPFADDQFDILFCSAVLEHVGSRQDQKIFVREALRVSRKFFFSTPNRWFPVEFHTLLPLVHWLPQPAHQAILRGLGHEFLAKTENLNLLSVSDIDKLFEGVWRINIQRISLLGFTSNVVVYGEKR